MMLVFASSKLSEFEKSGYRVVPVDLTGRGQDQNSFVVVDKENATDGNDNTYANAAFWGAGQGIKYPLGREIVLVRARLVADCYQGPAFGSCKFVVNGRTLIDIPVGSGKQDLDWTGETRTSQINVDEYARTRIYTVELWEKVSA